MNDAGPSLTTMSPAFTLRMVVLFALLVLVLSVVAVQVYRIVGAFVDDSEWVSHTYRAKEQIVSTVARLRDAEAAQRAYLIAGDASRLSSYYVAVPELDKEMAALRALVADNPQQVEAADRLAALIGTREQWMAKAILTYQAGGLDALRADPAFAETKLQDQAVDAEQARMLAVEDALLVERQARSRATADRTRVMTTGAIALCFGVLVVALVVILREQRRRVASEARVVSSYAELTRTLEDSRRLGSTLRQLSELGEMLQAAARSTRRPSGSSSRSASCCRRRQAASA